MKVGILGAGRIAVTMAKTLQGISDKAEPYAIGSRNLEKAKEFAKQNKIEKAYGSYEELVKDPLVDLIYIATPHSHHFENMKLCIENNKAVLCEKSFTQNAKQAKEILALAEQKKVLVTEAIWTRYMPSRKIINEIIQSGIVGSISMLTANLHYAITDKERLVKPELAGGALLDVGVYPINFALMHFGSNISKIESSVRLSKNNLDEINTMTFFYEDGKVASLNSGMLSRSDRKGIFYGEKGYIIVENINNPQSISVFDDNDKLIKKYKVPKQITGYEYEVLECAECLKQGKIECDSIKHSETIAVMEIMDSLRKKWNVIYPGEDL